MNKVNQMMLDYLRNGRFPPDHRLVDICLTLEECSKDDANNRYLVHSMLKAIKFEKLTEWTCGGIRQAADAMTFTENNIVLIEFKAGDKTKHANSKRKLINNIIGKINDSDYTIYQDILSGMNKADTENAQVAFYLVVDAKEMGIDSRTAALLQLSLGSKGIADIEQKLNYLIEELLPALKNNTSNPEHFSEIDIWYSDIFDTYLQEYGIVDILSRF